MTVQTEDIGTKAGVLFTCDNPACERAERRPYIPIELGGHIAQARGIGYRIGDGGKPCYCPECTGIDLEYWDRQTLNGAYAAGIDAGNTAWSKP
jgi:hypothetical protein